jgi:hypothetical protein
MFVAQQTDCFVTTVWRIPWSSVLTEWHALPHVWRNSFVFSHPKFYDHIHKSPPLVLIIFVCRMIRIHSQPWSWRYIFVFFFHIRLNFQAAFCVRLFRSKHFKLFVCTVHVLLNTMKLTFSMIYVTWLPDFSTYLPVMEENSYYRVASQTT